MRLPTGRVRLHPLRREAAVVTEPWSGLVMAGEQEDRKLLDESGALLRVRCGSRAPRAR
jgi:hypothetical protein